MIIGLMLYGKEEIKMPVDISKTAYKYKLETDDCESCVGIVYASNYNDAMAQVTACYKDLEIKSITIKVCISDIIELYRG